MFHPLQPDQRGKTLREISRVLVPGGSLHLVDFERPDALSGRLGRWLHSSDHLNDNSEERILALLEQAGFVSSRKVVTGSMVFGLLRMGYYRARVGIT